MDIYFKNHCESCGVGIEFPANGVGEQIPCPHCQQLLTLAFPEDSDGTATTQIQDFLAASSFPTTRAELLLLSNFASPTQANDLRALERSANCLDGNPKAVLDRLVSEGLLQECNSDLIRLLQTKSSSDLKSMARAREIPHSGTKEILAKRLVKDDQAGMAQLFHGIDFLVCTVRGAMIVEKFQESEQEMKRQAERDALLALIKVRLQEMKQTGIKRVKVLGSTETCPACRAESGKVYAIEAAPVLPHEGCSCERGCVCLLIATE
jgi:hypothetical protein